MASLTDTPYEPDPNRHRRYDELYDEYRRLHDLFGRGGDETMLRLRELKARASPVSPSAAGYHGISRRSK